MMMLIRAEILKLKRCWLVSLSFAVTLVFPLLALLLTTLSQAQAAKETQFYLFIRQNHIFLTLITCNLLVSLLAAHLFTKEYQYGTIVDILAVPVNRMKYILAKELVLLGWILLLGIASYLLCLLFALLLGMDGMTGKAVLEGFWHYTAAATLGFIPMQLVVLVTVLLRSMVVSLGVSIVALVGAIVAFNTDTLIFYYPFSIAFVLTNFAQAPTQQQILTSLVSLVVVAMLCLPAVFLNFRRMDIRS
jgi:hypothetical protein